MTKSVHPRASAAADYLRWYPHPSQTGLVAAGQGNQRQVNCSGVYLLSGHLDEQRLVRAYEQALSGFDSLRLSLDTTVEPVRWRDSGACRVEVLLKDSAKGRVLQGLDPTLRSELQATVDHAFDIADGPAGAVEIHRLSPGKWAIAETFHHALADGRSLALLHSAVAACYRRDDRARCDAPAYLSLLSTEPPVVQADTRAYWATAFEGYEAAQAPKVQADTEKCRWDMTLDAARVTRLSAAAARFRATTASALLTAHTHAVARHLGRGDVSTYVAIDGRDEDSARVFGQMTSLVPIRIGHEWSADLGAHLSTVARGLLRLREHLAADVDLLDQLQVPISLSRPDASVFGMYHVGDSVIDLPGVRAEPVTMETTDQAGGFTTVVRQHADGSIDLALQAPRGSGFSGLLQSIGETIDITLSSIEEGASVRLGSDDLLPMSSRLLVQYTAAPSQPYPFAPLDEDILGNLEELGERPVLDDGEIYSAQNLLIRVRSTGKALSEAGVSVGDAVIVGDLPAVDRIAALVATLDMGAVYVPFDTSATTADRKRLSTIRHVTNAVAEVTAAGVHQRRVSDQPATRVELTPCSPAYAIFTSGSTGTPKGVLVSRESLSNVIRGAADSFGFDADTKLLLAFNPTFDAWIYQVLAALLFRATLVRADVASATSLEERMREGKVTHAILLPAFFRLLGDADLPDLRMIGTGGDHCRAQDLLPFLDRKVYNLYGPTEGTIHTTVAEVTAPVDPVPVGRPIPGTGARVVIDRMASAPLGVPGELALSGAGVALGYLGDDEASGHRFGVDPIDPRQRAYYTGDRAWLTAGGDIVLAGRVDRQIKVRGNRIESESIEAAARSTGLCTDARVRTYSHDQAVDKILVLYVEGCDDVMGLSSALSELVPSYAKPHHVRALHALPRHPSGKVDEGRLPSTYHEAIGAVGELADSLSELGRIWTRLLGTRPQPDDHFFASGGDSLSVLRLVREARARGLVLNPGDVYARPRFVDLEAASESRASPSASGEAGLHPDQIPLGPAQLWFTAMDFADPKWWNQRHAIAFDRLPSASRLAAALSELIDVTPVLTMALDPGALEFVAAPSSAITVEVVDEPDSDEDLASLVEQLNLGIDHLGGTMVKAAAIRDGLGGGVLLLVIHHLVVDIWSWNVIEDRLRGILGRSSGAAVVPQIDQGFSLFSHSVRRQLECGAFDIDSGRWARILGNGRTGVLGVRPSTTDRLVATISSPTRLSSKWGAPESRILLAALGHALRLTSGAGTTVVDLERNGRAAIHGLDLSDAVGWLALHHPISVRHTELTSQAVHRITSDIGEIPDFGLSYGALRWTSRADLGDQIGRFIVDFSSALSTSPGHNRLHQRIQRVSTPMRGSNHLPYEAGIFFRSNGDAVDVTIDFDADRVPRQEAQDMLTALGDVMAHAAQSRTPAPSRKAEAEQPDVPVGTTQRLMLHHAAQGQGVYLPRQLIEITGVDDADRFREALSTCLPHFAPFRQRFYSTDNGIRQRWLLPSEPLAVRRFEGDLQAARAWFGAADGIDTVSAITGGALVDVVLFEGHDSMFLGLETHHAIMDGVSNQALVTLVEKISRHARGDAALPETPDRSFSRSVIRKHVSAEGPHVSDELGLPPVLRLERLPVDWSHHVSTQTIRGITQWAMGLGGDLRAGLAAIVSEVVRERLGVEALCLVTNGRDVDIPGSADASGMFWYFQRAPLAGADLTSLVRMFFSAESQPMRAIRRAAVQWPKWTVEDVSFNFTKASTEIESSRSVQVLEQRDIFHFGTQVSIAVDTTGSATLRCTSTGLHGDGRAVLDAIVDSMTAVGSPRGA